MSTTRVRETRLSIAEAPAEGDVRIVEIEGLRIGLYRVGEELHALADRCPHRGAPICSGRVVTPIEVRDGSLELGDRASVLRYGLGWRGRRAAYLVLAGFALVVVVRIGLPLTHFS